MTDILVDRRRLVAKTAAVAALVGLFAVLCGPASAQTGIATPKDVAAIFEKATAEGDAATLAALYTPDAILLVPGAPPIVGRPAIQAVFERNFSLGMNSMKFSRVSADVGQDRAAVLWSWRSGIKLASGRTVRTDGLSLVYFTLVDGGWLIRSDAMHVTPAR